MEEDLDVSADISAILKGDDILNKGDVNCTIKDVKREVLGQGDKAEKKVVLYFNGSQKKLPLNKTNLSTIASLYGSQAASWRGKRLTIFATPVNFQGKVSNGIRIRLTAPNTVPPVQQVHTAPPVTAEPVADF
jgi:hypothetical protein